MKNKDAIEELGYKKHTDNVGNIIYEAKEGSRICLDTRYLQAYSSQPITLNELEACADILKGVRDNKTETKTEKQICVICKKPYSGYGNNAWPITTGQCCDECNNTKVIPERLKRVYIV